MLLLLLLVLAEPKLKGVLEAVGTTLVLAAALLAPPKLKGVELEVLMLLLAVEFIPNMVELVRVLEVDMADELALLAAPNLNGVLLVEETLEVVVLMVELPNLGKEKRAQLSGWKLKT